jgi:hypothetical protein
VWFHFWDTVEGAKLIPNDKNQDGAAAAGVGGAGDTGDFLGGVEVVSTWLGWQYADAFNCQS